MTNPFKNKLTLLLAGLFLLLLIIVLILPDKKSNVGQAPTTINIPAFNERAALAPATSEEGLSVQPKTATLYSLADSSQAEVRSFFQPIANNLALPAFPESIEIDRVPHFFWADPPNFLTVNLVTGSFTLDLHKHPPAGTKISETDALLFVKNWLSRYELLEEDWQHQTEYFADIENEMIPQATALGADVYLFSFSPTIDGLPIFNTDSIDTESSINATIDSFGNILSIYYQLPALFFANPRGATATIRPLLSPEQVEQKILQNVPVITAINFANGQFVPTTANLTSVAYQQIILGYSNDTANGSFVPVFQLTGTGALDSGETVTITAYLPALAE